MGTECFTQALLGKGSPVMTLEEPPNLLRDTQKQGSQQKGEGVLDFSVSSWG